MDILCDSKPKFCPGPWITKGILHKFRREIEFLHTHTRRISNLQLTRLKYHYCAKPLVHFTPIARKSHHLIPKIVNYHYCVEKWTYSQDHTGSNPQFQHYLLFLQLRVTVSCSLSLFLKSFCILSILACLV